MLKEINGTHTILYFYDGLSICSIQVDGQSYFLRRNLFQDVTHIYDLNGNLVASYLYDAWGNHQVFDANGVENTNADFIGNINPIRYRGYYFDVETNLYYLNDRYYDPEVGRFISLDAVDYLAPDSIHGLNLFAYCFNNPIMYADPSGYSPEWWQWALAGVGLALVAVAAGMAILGTGGITAFGMGALIGSLAMGVGGTIVGGVIGYAVDGVDGILGGALTGFGIGVIIGFVLGGSINYASYLRSTVVVNGQRVPVYRGGNNMQVKTGEYKILTNGTKRGISVNTNPAQVQNFGGAYRIQKVPRGLKIVQQGKNLSHFEIIPNKALSLNQYQALLKKVVLIGI